VRLLFVSSTTVGGSGRSQRELAARLRDRDHEVLFLVDLGQPARLRRWAYEQLSDLSVRWGDRAGSTVLRWLEGRPGRRCETAVVDGLRHFASPVPENAAARVIGSFGPDLVIGSSALRLTWRKVNAVCHRHQIPTVLYVREVEAMNHFESGAPPADAVVANAESLARRIEALGFACPVFPSVIEVEVTKVESSKRVALAINPIASRGVETVWRVAERLPQVPFVIQESWPLSAEDLRSVERHLASLPNVEFRRAEPPSPRLYRDARVLLVPYVVDNRPRVIAEAQANGIPVIVADSPALVEAASVGGLIVPADDIDGWCRSIQLLWSDATAYASLSHDAFRHSTRDDIAASAVAQRVDAFLRSVVSGT
jgi:glycosyltransferase involved in cell wall biosynthesis